MRLILLRHAKSDWAAGVSDHERPLNARGRRTAPQVGAWLAAQGWAPQAVRSSDAARTHETWLHLAEHLPGVVPTFTPRLYLASPPTIIELVRGLPAGETTLLLGHNPGLSDAARWLSGQPVDLGTADAALLEGPGDDWHAVTARPGQLRLVRHLVARQVAGDR